MPRSNAVTGGIALTLTYMLAVLLSRNYPEEIWTWPVPGWLGHSYQWFAFMTVFPAALAALLLTDQLRRPSPRAIVIGGSLGLAVLAEAVSALTSAEIVDSLSHHVLPHLALWFLFLALVSTPSQQAVRWVAIGLILVALIQSLVAVYQGFDVTLPTLLGIIDSPHQYAEADDVKWTRFPPAFGLTAWPTILAALLAVVAPFCLMLRRRSQRFGIAGLLALALVLSFGRSAWIGLIAAGIVGGTVWLLHGRARAAGVGVALVLLGMVGILGVQPRLIDQASSLLPLAPAAASRGERELAQDVAIDLWKRQPILGVGSGNSAIAARQHSNYASLEERIVPAHNWLILSLAERGIIGALAMLVLWAGPVFWLLVYGKGRTDAIFAASLTALAVSQWFDYELTYWIGGSLLQTIVLALWVRSSMVPESQGCVEQCPSAT